MMHILRRIVCAIVGHAWLHDCPDLWGDYAVRHTFSVCWRCSKATKPSPASPDRDGE